MASQEQIDAARAAKAAYMREWRRKNRDKDREYRLKYWIRKAEAAAREAGQK